LAAQEILEVSADRGAEMTGGPKIAKWLGLVRK
jgi:hypothetical protein